MTRYLALALLVALTGCALGPYAPDYGYATHNNVAAQALNPVPPPAGRSVPGNGELGALAQKRYTTDAVKPPVAMMTTNGLEGNTNGNGSTGVGAGTSGTAPVSP